MMSLTNFEKETIVNYNAAEKTASIYTADQNVMRKLDALVKKYPDIYKVVEQDSYSKTYTCPKKLVSFRSPKILTEEQKEKLRAQLRNIK